MGALRSQYMKCWLPLSHAQHQEKTWRRKAVRKATSQLWRLRERTAIDHGQKEA